MISREATLNQSESFLSKRRLAVAGIAAVIGCAACCAIPLLAVAGFGGGAAAALSTYLHPGSELIIGLVVFGGALAVMAVRARLNPAPQRAGQQGRGGRLGRARPRRLDDVTRSSKSSLSSR